MTSQLCTEASTLGPLDESHSIEKNFLPAVYFRQFQATNNDEVDITETSPLSTEEQAGQKTQSTRETLPKSGNQKNSVPFCNRFRKKILFTVIGMICLSLAVMSVYIVLILNEISKIKGPKPVMLYRPTEEYLESDERPVTIKWRLVEEHSQSPFNQINTTHLHVKEDGFYHISCSLLMETNSNHTNVITLLIFYSNKDGSIYTKKTLPTGFSRFSLQQSIVLHLRHGDYFYVQVIPSKYLLKDPDASYLSIVQK